MKPTQLTKSVEKVIALKLATIDRVIEELVEPLEKIGSPEDLIKKPYAQWTPEDLALLIKIYGQGENTPLTRTIFNRTYQQVLELEAEEK